MVVMSKSGLKLNRRISHLLIHLGKLLATKLEMPCLSMRSYNWKPPCPLWLAPLLTTYKRTSKQLNWARLFQRGPYESGLDWWQTLKFLSHINVRSIPSLTSRCRPSWNLMTNTSTMESLLFLTTGIVRRQEYSTLTCHPSKNLQLPLESRATLQWLKKQLEMEKRMKTIDTFSLLSTVVQSMPLLWKKEMPCFGFNLLLSILICIRMNVIGSILMPPSKS